MDEKRAFPLWTASVEADHIYFWQRAVSWGILHSSVFIFDPPPLGTPFWAFMAEFGCPRFNSLDNKPTLEVFFNYFTFAALLRIFKVGAATLGVGVTCWPILPFSVDIWCPLSTAFNRTNPKKIVK